MCDAGSMAQIVCPLVSAEDRARLEAIIGDRNRAQKHMARARIILGSAARLSVTEIASAPGSGGRRSGAASSLDFPLHPDLGLLAECGRDLLLGAHPAPAQARELPLGGRPSSRDQPLYRRAQPRPQALSPGPRRPGTSSPTSAECASALASSPWPAACLTASSRRIIHVARRRPRRMALRPSETLRVRTAVRDSSGIGPAARRCSAVRPISWRE